MKLLLTAILLTVTASIALAVPPVGGIIGLSGNGILLAQGNDPSTDTDTGTNFGYLPVGATGHAHIFAMHNLGTTGGALKVDDIVVTGTDAQDFVIAVPPLNMNVGRGATEPFTMVFSPTSTGTRTAILEIHSQDNTTPVFSVNLTGEAVDAFPALPDLKTVVKAKAKFDLTSGTVRLKGKVFVYNAGTTGTLGGSVQIYRGADIPLDGAMVPLTSVPFAPIPAPLPGKKAKKVKTLFDVTYPASQHGAFFRATGTDPADLDRTDNFTYRLVEPK